MSVVLQAVPFAFPLQSDTGVPVFVGFGVCVGVEVAFGLVVAVGGAAVGVGGQPVLGTHCRLPGQLTDTPEQLPLWQVQPPEQLTHRSRLTQAVPFVRPVQSNGGPPGVKVFVGVRVEVGVRVGV